MGKTTYTMRGVRNKRTCAYDVGRGSNFCHFGVYVQIE